MWGMVAWSQRRTAYSHCSRSKRTTPHGLGGTGTFSEPRPVSTRGVSAIDPSQSACCRRGGQGRSFLTGHSYYPPQCLVSVEYELVLFRSAMQGCRAISHPMLGIAVSKSRIPLRIVSVPRPPVHLSQGNVSETGRFVGLPPSCCQRHNGAKAQNIQFSALH